LSELHLEENKYLVKLAKANSALDGLRKKVVSLQSTIATYTNHIQQINEKKRKLITDISENAKMTTSSYESDFEHTPDFQHTTRDEHENFAGDRRQHSLEMRSYTTPPGSPAPFTQSRTGIVSFNYFFRLFWIFLNEFFS